MGGHMAPIQRVNSAIDRYPTREQLEAHSRSAWRRRSVAAIVAVAIAAGASAAPSLHTPFPAGAAYAQDGGDGGGGDAGASDGGLGDSGSLGSGGGETEAGDSGLGISD